MDAINWNEIDSFPLFENCDEMASKMEQQKCFQETFASHMSSAIDSHSFLVTETISDTIYLHLTIDNEGALSILAIAKSNEINTQLPDLENILINAINDLPRIYPALKKVTSSDTNEAQLIPVAVKLNLPIIVSVD
ncbi:hypothetical protein [Leptobacterium sp. I13]|uniref:hypothetical protein n=1 Tax=Leptobacterium meishanense TaxID=3128904 RepID=UPI0030EB2E95